MNTRVWRFAGLALGLLLSRSAIQAQAHREKPDPCKDTSNITQREMNDCAVKELRKVEGNMERLLKQLGIAADSPEQKAWEAYRDAQLAALYPPGDTSNYGSTYPMCIAILRKTLIEGRIRDLKALTVSGEGDVCHGYRDRSRSSD